MQTYPSSDRRQAEDPPLDALTETYLRYYPQLLAIAGRGLGAGYHDDREDLVQEAYLRVRTRGRQVDVERARAYLCQTVANLARDAVRRRMVRDRHRLLPALTSPSAEERVLGALLPEPVVDRVRDLPRRQRQAVVLRHYVGLAPDDAATAMGCTPVAVRAYTSRALATLTRQIPAPTSAAQAA